MTTDDGRKDGQGPGPGAGAIEEAWIPSEEDMAYVDEAALELMPLAVQMTGRQQAVIDGSGPPRVEFDPAGAALFAYRFAAALARQRELERASVRYLLAERLHRAQRAATPNGALRLADRAGGTEGVNREP